MAVSKSARLATENTSSAANDGSNPGDSVVVIVDVIGNQHPAVVLAVNGEHENGGKLIDVQLNPGARVRTYLAGVRLVKDSTEANGTTDRPVAYAAGVPDEA